MKINHVIERLHKVLGWFREEAQVEMERILKAWIAGRPASGQRYRTDGKSVYYFDSEILRTVPGGFEISNQGWTTSTTRKVLNTILDYIARPGRYRIFIRGGEMGIEDQEEGISYIFPTGKNRWVKFDHAGNLVSKLQPFETIPRRFLPGEVLKKILEHIKISLRLGASSDEIIIPGTDEYTLADLFEDYIIPLRRVYSIMLISSFEEAIRNEHTSWFAWHDLKTQLNRLYAEGKLDIEKAIKRLKLK